MPFARGARKEKKNGNVHVFSFALKGSVYRGRSPRNRQKLGEYGSSRRGRIHYTALQLLSLIGLRRTGFSSDFELSSAVQKWPTESSASVRSTITVKIDKSYLFQI